MLKFKCKDDSIIYLNPTQLCEMDNLKDSDNFQYLFSNLSDKNDNDEYTLLQTLEITYPDWFEFFSFIKYGVPMYYTLDIFNNPNKKETFIFNLEKLNVTCAKFGGIKKFIHLVGLDIIHPLRKEDFLRKRSFQGLDFKIFHLFGIF